MPNFNVYKLLTPDVLHEVEIGVVKALFTHLVRMLKAMGEASVIELNSRCVLLLSDHLFMC